MTQCIESAAEFEMLSGRERAVVSLWVNWAIHARHSATTAEQMVATWNRTNPEAIVDLLQIDLSEQSGALWDAVGEWLETQGVRDAGSLMYGGAGAIIWARSGVIMRYVVNANSETLNSLLAHMGESFGTPDKT